MYRKSHTETHAQESEIGLFLKNVVFLLSFLHLIYFTKQYFLEIPLIYWHKSGSSFLRKWLVNLPWYEWYIIYLAIPLL